MPTVNQSQSQSRSLGIKVQGEGLKRDRQINQSQRKSQRRHYQVHTVSQRQETLRNQPGASRKTGGDPDGGAKAKEQVPGEGNAEIGRENEEGNEVEKDLCIVCRSPTEEINEDSNKNLHKETLGKKIMEKMELEKGWKKKVVTVHHSNQKSKRSW
jgi:hypothetical protein